MLKRAGKRGLKLAGLSIGLAFFSLSPLVYAQTESTYQLLSTPFYDPNGSNNCSPVTTTGTATGAPADATTNIDIRPIVSKYGLQSAMAQKLGGPVLASVNADQPPTTPASTMKLIIADTFIRSGTDPAKIVRVTPDVYYNGQSDLNHRPSSVSLATALDEMLNHSSNVGANILMRALGGPVGFTNKARSYGYSHTNVRGYYDPSNDGVNSSTISDEVTAMNHLFSQQGSLYQAVQSALSQAAQSDNHYGVTDDANKWAGTSDVAGNVAKLKVGGQDYIIGVYINKDFHDSAAKLAVKNSTADIAAALLGGGTAAADDVDTASPDSNCCQTTTSLSGAGNAAKVWNYFIGKGLTNVQVAGIMGNLQIESHFDPTVIYGGGHQPDPSGVSVAWGLGQWLPGSKVLGIQKAAGVTGDISQLSTQLDIMWWEINNTSPTGTQHVITSLKSLNDVAAVVHYWQQFYEGSLGQADDARLAAAQEWAKYVAPAGSATDSSATTCSASTGTDAAAIVAEAIKLSWPDETHGTTPTDAYQSAYQQFNPNGPGLADCGGFVATVMHATADPNYPAGGTSIQEKYVRDHPEKYDIDDSVTSTAELQPGDILIINAGTGQGAAGHTLIYVGPQPPHGYDEASASLNDRSAGLGKFQPVDPRGTYMRARLK